ncbi:MAG: type II toxin-antitoxin system HicA family toxin [Candidatus Thermoplasmatota archaeon]|nr:type II toxin-antitoxin system HicA family toxin [Candidatus Thermoplasmatota archaeon]MBU4256380.1 type II toxin-antitoxin system HicA family toxin [Candidatus Thermoplasmatota archaeon]
MKLKPSPSEKVIKILTKIGFQKIRQKGSHVFLRHSDGRKTVVPVHEKTFFKEIKEKFSSGWEDVLSIQ